MRQSEEQQLSNVSVLEAMNVKQFLGELWIAVSVQYEDRESELESLPPEMNECEYQADGNPSETD
jgi:hypothetical protein